MTDDADTIAQKVRKARTDPEPLPSEVDGLAGRPEADNLVTIFATLAGRSRADVLGEFGGKLFSEFKGALVDLAVATLGPIGAEMRRLTADTAYVDAILKRGAERAGEIGARHMNEVKDIMGLLRP
jgi:tryptophanyl-tRNA synthetase